MEPLRADDPGELGSYRLLRRLGAGGMGRVYLARSPGGRTVAVKVVRPDLAADEDFRTRFRHEVEIARAVSGRYTAPVVDAAPDAPLPWLATSYVLGPDLTEVVDAHGGLPERTVVALGAGLAAALTEIHASGLIHRDLKPSNVLLAADGPRVIDFGIARAIDGNRLTQTGVVVGSPGYMPPEQAMGGDVGVAGDVFSLGAVLAFAATGRNAFGEGSSHAAMLYQVVHAEPDLTGVPQRLQGLVRACLLKDPAQRPTPTEVVAALAPHGVESVLTDWLPSAVASTIATHAAGILDLEAPEGPTARPAAAFGPPATAVDASGGGAGPLPGGPSQYGTPAPGTFGSPAPATVASGLTRSERAMASRRRILGVAVGALGVAAVGGGSAWWLRKDDGPSASPGGDVGSGAEPEAFATPPDGVAPQPLWHRSTAEDSISSTRRLLTHEGMLLISADPFIAYDVKNKGKKRWTSTTDLPVGSPLLLAGGKLFMASTEGDGVLIGLNARTGREAWRSRLGRKLRVEKTIAVDEKNVYVTVTDLGESRSATDFRTAVAAINHSTGRQTWLRRRDWGTDDYDVDGTVVGKRLIYTDSKMNITVRDTATGEQLWSNKIGDDWQWTPAAADGLIFLPGENLTGVDIDSGDVRWTLPPNGRRGFDSPTYIDGVLYVRDHDDGVWAVNAKSGRKIWLCEDSGARRSPTEFLRVGSTLYGASAMDEGGVVALKAKNGEPRWNYNDTKTPGAPWHLAASGNRLLVTHGSEIYALPAV
ncbi:serine/threonine-protein kinase [Streptomyces alboniger]|uniref:Serine/threonine protein kinase n=1 Tax=Streptomyces alboniger TaxID=132473 RepID=A0A5J6HR90_STRAD|nr:serine/threonine-protein kinase [Streptomyces alboniger]QEV19537.1 serine/threonine protein kinase [Streptomyces alboniger]